jgi:hypothetical protein
MRTTKVALCHKIIYTWKPSRNHDGSWRIKTNYELNNLIKGRNIVNLIKAQRISWLGHIRRMGAGRAVKRYMTGSHTP